MNPFSFIKSAAIACFALQEHPLESKNILPEGPWQIVSLPKITPLETDLDSRSTALNPLDQWALVDLPPELNNCGKGWTDVSDEAGEQKRKFSGTKFQKLKRPKPGRGKHGMSSEEIIKYLNNVGLDYEVLPGPQMSLKECAKNAVSENWTTLKENSADKAWALFQDALTVEAACISVQGISNIAVPTTLKAVPGTVSSILQVLGCCTSACALAPTVAQNVCGILGPACKLVSAVSVIGSEQAKETYEQYAPGLRSKYARLSGAISNKASDIKHRLHGFTSRR